MTPKSESKIVVFLAAASIAVAVLVTLPSSAQDTTRKKIPFEIVEEGPPDDAGKTDSMAEPAGHRVALGVNLNFFPTVLSVIDGEFGLGIQPWFGIDQFKIRLDITHMRIPNSLAATRYFYKNDVNTFSLVVQYCFGKNFDGFSIGAGIGLWNNMVSHAFFNRKGSSIAPYLTIEGGYIWKFYNNLYIEPCLALDVMLTRQKIRIYGFEYKPFPVAGEIMLKFGINVDL